MDKLNFLVAWNKDKQRTWSGTCWGLLSALQKYFCVNDIDISIKRNRIERIIYGLAKKIFRIDDQFGLADILTQRDNYKNRFDGNKKNIVFQFSEVIPNTSNIDSYIYIDEDVNHVKYLYENEPAVFNMSNFSSAKISSINRRNISQTAYFETCSGIFTMGKWLKNSIVDRLKISPDKVHHVGGGINLDTSLIDESRKMRNKILFVGRDFERKGGKLVVEAFKLLRYLKSGGIELHIAGPENNPVTEEIEGVYFHGDCNHERVSELMNSCDVFCMPSYFEAYGLVFIEALVYGLPCIGRNCYEMPYFIEDGRTGLLIDKDDPEKLARNMAVLLEDFSFTQRVKEKRNWYIEEYSWETVAKRINNIIN